jgi:hypothetical protein
MAPILAMIKDFLKKTYHYVQPRVRDIYFLYSQPAIAWLRFFLKTGIYPLFFIILCLSCFFFWRLGISVTLNVSYTRMCSFLLMGIMSLVLFSLLTRKLSLLRFFISLLFPIFSLTKLFLFTAKFFITRASFSDVISRNYFFEIRHVFTYNEYMSYGANLVSNFRLPISLSDLSILYHSKAVTSISQWHNVLHSYISDTFVHQARALAAEPLPFTQNFLYENKFSIFFLLLIVHTLLLFLDSIVLYGDPVSFLDSQRHDSRSRTPAPPRIPRNPPKPTTDPTPTPAPTPSPSPGPGPSSDLGILEPSNYYLDSIFDTLMYILKKLY